MPRARFLLDTPRPSLKWKEAARRLAAKTFTRKAIPNCQGDKAMAFRLKLTRSLKANVKRLVRRQLDKAKEAVSSVGEMATETASAVGAKADI